MGSAEWQQRARAANRNPPTLMTHDQYGVRVNAAEYHPAYHELMRLSLESGAAAFAWGEHAHKRGRHTARGALMYLMYQLECGGAQHAAYP